MTTSRYLIQQATIMPCTLQPDGALDLVPRVQDVLIVGDQIVEVADHIEPGPETTQVINARNHLLVPGFVNAHAHSAEILEKGRYEALPLELWMLYSYPPLKGKHLSPRMCYLRTVIGALEVIKTGTTTLQDDLIELPYITPEIFAAVAQAYIDVGLRVSLTHHVINLPLYKTIPYLDEFLPDDVRQDLDAMTGLDDDAWLSLFKASYADWHGKNGLITLALAPSAPQRVTPDLMHQIGEISESLDIPIHTHMLETKTQAVTGPEFYGPGESVVSYGKQHGILTHRTAIAHGIWLTDQDVELIAAAGATVIHNVVSNHRLCSGIAPIRQLMDAGVNIALGSDGMSSNDSFNMFDVLKMAGLVHSVTRPDYSRAPRARDVLKWATYGGARSALLQDQVGAIAPGFKADCVLYDLNTTSFIPRGELPIHLVYAEHGASIRKVFINGQLVVADGTVLTVDESALLEELQDLLTEYEPERAELYRQAERLLPAVEATYQKAMAQPLAIERFTRIEE
ncbi:amidohydrolase family protein [Leptothoe sp. PORK10 BA2]|uniref:amidohydrolase family protein n=1 Tax=Leptothoe sp. PORK10 BA2 TaxID=3110254 RepID=UPI002B205E0F|nr:amidohydrolase family protein [Leptothoe sp. PORK10 BA2]MEA5463749.1 amidohydrolase family protein [Leptothoe sp. PORK10 BA2]